METQNKKKIEYIKEYERIDGLTGEVEQKKIDIAYYSKIPTEPAFVKLYLQDILYLSDLQPSQAGILYELIKNLNYNNQIVLNPAIKKTICKSLDIQMSTLNNTITKFVKADILFRIDKGVYQLNPYLFGRGDWSNIYKLRLEIDYTLQGRTFKTTIQGQEKEKNK